MAQVEIIGAPLSNYVWTTRIACAEKGVPHVLKPARPHTPDVDAIHPLGKIPVMRHGDVTLFESRAICAYLDRAFEGPALVPGDAAQAAGVEQWVSFVAHSVDPAIVRAYALAYIFPGTPDGAPDRKRIEAALPMLEKVLGILDAQIGKNGYLAGASFTLADIYLIPILAVANRLPESKAMLAGLPRLAFYLQQQMARDSVKSTAPPPPPAKG